MSTRLADGNLLIALTVNEHVHHHAARAWFGRERPQLATCPITEGTLLRFLLREGTTTVEAVGVLDAIRAQPWHEFWTDAVPYDRALLRGVIGHRQVTDAYLATLAAEHGGTLATFDRGLAALRPDQVELIAS